MVIIVTSVLIEGPHVTPELKGDPSKRFTFIGPGVFQAIGVISFAFVCHHNSLLIYGSLRTPTLDRFAKVTHISTFMSLVACCTLAISAYIVFTDKTQGNILNNFAAVCLSRVRTRVSTILTLTQSDTLINVARFCFGLNMFTTLPLELFVCREVSFPRLSYHWALFLMPRSRLSSNTSSPMNHLACIDTFSSQRRSYSHPCFVRNHRPFPSRFASFITFNPTVSLITCDLGVMLEITGGASATALAFIFPAACYLKLLPDHKEPWYRSRIKLPAVLCAAFGMVVMCISLFLALGKVWTPEGTAKICV